MMQRHEAEGTLDHPEYRAAIEILSYRHTCRLQEWPAPLMRSIDAFNPAPLVTIQGPNDYSPFTGNIRDWSRLDRLHEIDRPALVLCGLHDVLTPASAGLMQRALPNARLKVFQNSGHVPFLEEPEAYAEVLSRFLVENRAGPAPGSPPRGSDFAPLAFDR
jgi:proline iminopeptidase